MGVTGFWYYQRLTNQYGFPNWAGIQPAVNTTIMCGTNLPVPVETLLSRKSDPRFQQLADWRQRCASHHLRQHLLMVQSRLRNRVL